MNLYQCEYETTDSYYTNTLIPAESLPQALAILQQEEPNIVEIRKLELHAGKVISTVLQR
jgi:hypothetical protein